MSKPKFQIGDTVKNCTQGTGIIEGIGLVYRVRFDIAGLRNCTEDDLRATNHPPMDASTAEHYRRTVCGVLDGNSN